MNTLGNEIFNVIKGANYDIVLFTDGGAKTIDPENATRFYISDQDMMISIRVESNKLELVVQLGTDFDINSNKKLLDSLKSAVHKQMGKYTVKRFDKNIEPKDFSHQSVTEENTEINRLRELSGITHESYSDYFQYAEEESTLEEGTWKIPDTDEAKAELAALMQHPIAASEAVDTLYHLIGNDDLADSIDEIAETEPDSDVRFLVKNFLQEWDIDIYPVTEDYDLTEGFSRAFGSVRTSYIQLENARLIIKHNKGVNEEVRGSRSRNIHSLFVENAEGERQKFPHKYMAGAKAMAMHVNNGGVFEDAKGIAILSMCKEATELAQFITHVKQNKLVNEGNANVVETVKSQLSRIKETIRSLQTVKGYTGFQVKEVLENEDKTVDVSDKFLYNTFENVDMDSVLSTVSRIFNEREGQQTMHAKVLNDVMDIIKSGDDLKINLDVNDPENPYNEDKVKYSGGNGPLAMLSAVLSYVGMSTKNDVMFNHITQLSNDVHDMSHEHRQLAAKIANYLYKKGTSTQTKEQPAPAESIVESVMTELRRKIS